MHQDARRRPRCLCILAQAFGIGSIDEDADDLLQLLTVLRERYGSQGVVLLGHSTGCQDSVRYAQLYRNSSEAAELLGLVLQAPVSDPDYLATQPETNGRLAAAEALAAAGRADQTAFRATEMDGAAVTAERWLSLAEHGGDEDMFSANLTAGQRAAIFAQLVGLPTLVLQGGADEYIPAGELGAGDVGGRSASSGSYSAPAGGAVRRRDGMLPAACGVPLRPARLLTPTCLAYHATLTRSAATGCHPFLQVWTQGHLAMPPQQGSGPAQS